MKVSDYIAFFFKERGVDLAFAITGSGSIRLIQSFEDSGIKYICPHHEQAGIMAAITRMRITGNPAVMMVTGGPGAGNTLLGLADAYLDSIPIFIISGQENLEYIDPPNEMRGKGVQGLNMVEITKTVTKYSYCLTNPDDIVSVLNEAYKKAYEGRPGPVWIEIPQNLQHAEIDLGKIQKYNNIPIEDFCDYENVAKETLDLICKSKRPLIWVGHGVRISNSIETLKQIQSKMNIPALVSWQAADILTDEDSNFVGRAGTYGQRFANLALQNCDLLITLGTRLALPQRGFNDSTFSRASKKVIVEIDPIEINKFKFKIDVPVLGDVGKFLTQLNSISPRIEKDLWLDWRSKITHWKRKYPMAIEPKDKKGKGINSYWFIDQLSNFLDKNWIIVTDMGTALTCTHATIKLKDGQRLITSTGLGEMGFGLPGAIGASLSGDKKNVLLIVGEGSFMMNIQELQTLKENNLNLKVFLINNNGYLTIKHTHNAIYKSAGNASACDKKTGVSFPNFKKVITAFGFDYTSISTTENLSDWIKKVLSHEKTIFAELKMPEFQELIPKSAIRPKSDGTIVSSPLEDMYPFLSREELKSEMIIPLLED